MQESKYDESYPDKLISHMERGGLFKQFTAVAGVSRATLYNWVKKHPDFAEAKEIGWGKSYNYWINEMKNNLVTHKDYRFNTAGWIFLMKNCFTWRDKAEVEHSGTVNQRISEESARKIAQRILGKEDKIKRIK